MTNPWTRRSVIFAAGATGLGAAGLSVSHWTSGVGGPAQTIGGGGVINIGWNDLAPEAGFDIDALRGLGVIEHGGLETGFDQEKASLVTQEYDGKVVKIQGFVVPFDFMAIGVSEFILAPYIGACIHVPPPPSNQLVFVTTDNPYEIEGMFDPVEVTGVIQTGMMDTSLAEIAYTMTAKKIEPFDIQW